MKNKILLLLVLLIPSLCFGIQSDRENLSVYISKRVYEKSIRIEITSSLMQESLGWNFEYGRHRKIPQSEFKRNEDMLKFTKTLFPKGFDKHLEYTKERYVNSISMYNFEKLAILNGYAVTFKSSSEETWDPESYGLREKIFQEIYLYKLVK